VVEAHGEDWASPETLVTNGAFRLAEWVPGASLTLQRSPDYPGRFPGNLQQVNLRLARNPVEDLRRYESGEMDVISVPPSIFAEVHQRYAGESLVFPMLNTHYLGFNSRQPPLSDRRVRRALVMGLNREELTGVILNGRYSLATGGFTPPGLPGHTPGIALPFDVEAARRLLAEAGYPNGEGFPELEFLGHFDPDARRSVQYVAKSWSENLGVRTRLESKSKVEVVSSSSGIWSLGWVADYPDADNFLRVAVETHAHVMFENPEYTRLITAARRSVDQAERVRLYQAADRILIDEAYLVPLTYGRNHLLIQPWVRNYQPLAMRNLNLKDLHIEEH
jgi:oligopeptide transport system substrate-binding protein